MSTPWRRTAPDGGYTESQFMAPDYDLSEVAARSSDTKSLRRDGRVFYSDNCDKLRPWSIGSGGGPAIVDNTECYDGTSSIKLTTLASSPYFSRISKIFPATTPRPIGLEFYAKISSLYVNFILTITTDVNDTRHLFRFYIENGVFKYRDALGSIITLEDLSQYLGNSPDFNNYKFVVDPSNGNYLRALINEREYNINAPAEQSAFFYGGKMDVEFQFVAPGSTQVDAWIDNIILTIDEYE